MITINNEKEISEYTEIPIILNLNQLNFYLKFNKKDDYNLVIRFWSEFCGNRYHFHNIIKVQSGNYCEIVKLPYCDKLFITVDYIDNDGTIIETNENEVFILTKK
jgi:hypothetical protein